ncbi:radical SAM protein [Dethiobacter alkaliphilus]|uniref:Radical SAM domain protein n=1 Tax=Dethiobacter alkaliphilus AHT 1 TaxID=555088 RepID=C0GCW8_DETAL|nr:radical SAM protein [Dethiobacter alkaliphilus]EEG79053.1 Radical SAM domain protein [Dethiobacter alkaliphilus AHT 1]
MRYEGMVYRPPSEAGSLIIQATVGCPHNRCTFCSMYRQSRFRLRSVDEIKEDLAMARDYYGDSVRTIFLADGNTIVMKTDHLVEILRCIRQLFPAVERITSYGSARFITKKKPADWVALREAGLSRIHSGMESGDDEVLRLQNKGVDAQGIVRAGQMIKDAGIELSEYIIVGAGGKTLSEQHAQNSARVLNRINPDFIRLRTLMPAQGTPLYDMFKKGDFKLLSPHEALAETRLFIEHLEGISSTLYSDHISNYWNVSGKFPGDKEAMLKQIDHALSLDEKQFRDPLQVRL